MIIILYHPMATIELFIKISFIDSTIPITILNKNVEITLAVTITR